MLWSGADQLYRPALHAHELNRQRNANATRANPVLLLLRLTVELALRDALRVHDGMPTQEALDAMVWLEARTDWTRRPGPIPPPALREQHVLSFEYCCRALDLDPEDIRQNGLMRLSGFAHNSKAWLPGVSAIKARWAEAKREYESAQAEEEALITLLVASE